MSHSVIQSGHLGDLHVHPAFPDIDPDRLLRRIEDLARIGRNTSGAITREGFSAADRRARAYLMAEAAAAGLPAVVDAGGNIVIRRPGRADRRALMTGSHLDTVVSAGRLDGVYGVVAALEVLQVFAESDVDSQYEPVAIAFANEEGALFPQPFWGSRVIAGRLAELPREPLDHHGQPLRDALALAGGDLDALPSAVWTPDSVAAYLELHVEQGAVLESSGTPIGVVSAITGRAVLTVEVRGAAGHAGATPMDGRRDALAAAARVLLAAEDIAGVRKLCRVTTVGRLDAHPNSPNTIADTVALTVDLRDTDPARMKDGENALRAALVSIAAQTDTEIEIVGRTCSEPVSTDATLRGAIQNSADELGLPSAQLYSLAGHDAQVVADIAPIAMVFVPSIGGLSHVPEEDTAPRDLLAGARVLLRTALKTARIPTT